MNQDKNLGSTSKIKDRGGVNPSGGPVPSSLNGNGTQEDPKSKRKAAQEMFAAVAQVCEIDIQVMTDDQRGQLNQTEKILREAGITPADLSDFGVWFSLQDWRGKKGQAPGPADVRKELGKFRKWRQKMDSCAPVDPDLNEDRQANSPEKNSQDLEWEQVLDGLRYRMDSRHYDFLEGSHVLEDRGKKLVIGVRDELAEYWMNRSFKQVVAEVFTGVVGHQVDVEFQKNGCGEPEMQTA